MIDNTNEVRTERGAVDSKQVADVTKGHATIHGAQLYFERTGRGAPVVLLHAGIADHHMWDTEFFALANEVDFLERIATLGPESDLATGLGGAVERKLVAPEPVDR